MDADVIIVGGGPAGSTLACYLGMRNVNVLLLEKAHHPRRHVGESLVPATTRVFKEIGFLDTMEREKFVKKPGACWTTWRSENESTFILRLNEIPQPGVDQDYTYHVNRERFDLANALVGKRKDKQTPCGLSPNASSSQVEQRIFIKLANRRAVCAFHIISKNLQLRLRVHTRTI